MGLWELGDHPYVYTTEDLLAFPYFSTDEYEISRHLACYLTLRLKEQKNTAAFCSTSILKTKRAERYTLYETIGDHTDASCAKISPPP